MSTPTSRSSCLTAPHPCAAVSPLVVTSTSAPRCQPSLVAADDASHKDMLVMRAQRARYVPDGKSARG